MTKMQLVHLVGVESNPTVARLLGEITINWSYLELHMRNHVSLLIDAEDGIGGVLTNAAGFEKWLAWSKELVALRSFGVDALSDWKITYDILLKAQKARNRITHAFISSSKIRGFNRIQSLKMSGAIDKRTVEVIVDELKTDDLREILRMIHEAQRYLSSWQGAYVYGPIGGGPARLPNLKPRKVVFK